MERYFKRKFINVISSGNVKVSQSSSTLMMPKLIDLKEIPSDPCDRKRILECHPNQRDEIRRTYILRGPT